MKAIVVYESMFGNTRTIAEAIARGLGGSLEVTVVRAGEADPSVFWDCPGSSDSLIRPLG
jgi:flavodoxin